MSKFQVIVSDPPWSFGDKLKMSDVPRGAAANYHLMTNSDIAGLDVKSLADPDGCVLALWVPSSLLQEGLDTMKAWGFHQKQTYVWVKTKKEPLEVLTSILKLKWRELPKQVFKKDLLKMVLNECASASFFDGLSFFMGRLFRQTHEICLIGTNNNKVYKKLENKSQRSVSFAENLKHSAKPNHLQESLEVMFPFANRLEMFARRHRIGWTCVGDEVCNGEDIRDSLKKITLKSPRR